MISQNFIQNKLSFYHERNHPENQYSSNLSPYLHFGQISPVEIALAVRNARQGIDVDNYLKALIVRRELAVNFIYYNPHGYHVFESITNAWAYETMDQHQFEKREYLYTFQQFKERQTHDPYWNVADKEMVLADKMHNDMRMYWCKKNVGRCDLYKIFENSSSDC